MARGEKKGGATDRANIRAILDRDEWFRSLPSSLAQAIVERSVARDFSDNALIYASGDPPTGQFVVLSGQVRLIANTRAGKLVLYRVVQPGTWFGHLAVLDQKPRFQDAVAVGPTSVLHLSAAAFDQIVEAEPRHAIHFARLICENIRQAMDMLAEALTMSLPGRLAHVVLAITEASDSTPNARHRMTQEALAAMTGASRQTVNRILRQWEKEGLVTIAYAHVSVRDNARLLAKLRRDDTHDTRGDR